MNKPNQTKQTCRYREQSGGGKGKGKAKWVKVINCMITDEK